MSLSRCLLAGFLFEGTTPSAIYTLSLHDALPIWFGTAWTVTLRSMIAPSRSTAWAPRSEEHTSELQSRLHLVCRLVLEKKKRYFPDSPRCGQARGEAAPARPLPADVSVARGAVPP